MVKVYLAARYSRKNEIAAYAQELKSMGFEVTSTWTEETHATNVQLTDITPATHAEYSQRDISEIDAADMMVFFSESPTEPHVRGGRHVEFGYALAIGLDILIVGPAENIFHYLPESFGIERVDTWLQAKSNLVRRLATNGMATNSVSI